jgi:hypothetical protein
MLVDQLIFRKNGQIRFLRMTGGVLNDMMCHSLEAARFLLTVPGAARDALRPISVTAQIVWSAIIRSPGRKRMSGRTGQAG